MRGEHQVVVRNNKVQIKLAIRRNLTILQGRSATGKSTLIDLVAQFDELGPDSGVTVNCDVPCKALSGRNWQRDLEAISGSIVFIDEDNAFMRSHEFARAAKASDNYYVLVAREALPQLPYSVDEIHELKNTGRSSSKYPAYSRIYTSTQRVYGPQRFDGSRPDLVVVEDSNSGFEFFSALCEKSGVSCKSAMSKTNVYKTVRDADAKSVLVIADGAAFGPEMETVLALGRRKRLQLFLPESFEWFVLSSGLFNDKKTQDMLLHPAGYIESADFFSWEQFFTRELIERTRGSYLAYGKSTLNPAYLGPGQFTVLESSLPDLGLA